MSITDFSIMDLLNTSISKLGELLKLNNIDWGNLTASIISIIFLVITSSFILWLLKSIGLYKIAKNNNDEYAFLAFIPYGCLYTYGKIVGKTTLFGINVSHPEFILPVLMLSIFLPFGKVISSILFVIFFFGILFRIYQKQIPTAAILLLLLSLILPFTIPFILFFIRNSNNRTNSTAK